MVSVAASTALGAVSMVLPRMPLADGDSHRPVSWYEVPVFTRWSERLFVRLISYYIRSSQRHPDAPEDDRERDLRPGDRFRNAHVTAHAP